MGDEIKSRKSNNPSRDMEGIRRDK